MKKRELSPIELKKVVELRQLGAKWTEIERETKVERRAAKRAYVEWERDKKMKEQEAVRFRVAAEAFHEHLNDLIRLAESLVSALHVPEML
jgi:DNA-directed RNA polymerase subunit E'/Rpb7